MQKVNFEYIWKFLQENNCESAGNFTKGMQCNICRKVMVNAHIGQCGCRYCLDCVTDCLNRNGQFCPGNTDDCVDQLMVIGETVVQDRGMNLDISKLRMKCARDSCDFTGELRRMEEHERLCRKQAVMCPYCHIGCQDRQLVNEEIDEHLTKENESHAKLLVDCVGRLQNEIQSMENEIVCLKKEGRDQQMAMERKDREIHVLQEEDRSMKEMIISLRQQVAEMRGLLGTQANLAEQLREHDVAQDGRLRELEQRARIERDEVRKNQAMSVHKGLVQVEDRSRGEFVWRIDNLAARRQAAQTEWVARKQAAKTDEKAWEEAQVDDATKVRIFSDTFQVHEQGYRMCLSVWPNGYFDRMNDLPIVWRLVRGPFDEYLRWPFKGTVTISIINQETELDFTSFTVSSAKYCGDTRLDRPISERNNGLVHDEPISVTELLANPAVYRNDQILIKCVVNISH